MLIDLLSSNNEVRFNSKVANLLGLQAAIYLSEVININEKAIKKDKIEDGFFTLSRKYLTDRTTITSTEQKEIENVLQSLSIIEIKDDNKLRLSIQALTSMLTSDNEKLSVDVSKVIKKSNKRSKIDIIKDNLKLNINTTNDELKQAYNLWIDSVFDKQGWMSKASVVVGEQLVDEYSNRDLDVALKIVNIAAVNGFRDMSWAVNRYKEDSSKKSKKQYIINKDSKNNNCNTNVELSNEVY